MKRSTTISDLICSECGSIMSIPRWKNDQREKFHIKDLYCIDCNKITKFIEIGNIDIYKKELEFKPELNEKEKLIYDLLQMDKEKRI